MGHLKVDKLVQEDLLNDVLTTMRYGYVDLSITTNHTTLNILREALKLKSEALSIQYDKDLEQWAASKGITMEGLINSLDFTVISANEKGAIYWKGLTDKLIEDVNHGYLDICISDTDLIKILRGAIYLYGTTEGLQLEVLDIE